MTFKFSRLKMAFVIFALVLENASPVVANPVAIVSSAVGAISQIIRAGTSLASLKKVATSYRVTCVIIVENWTRYALIYPIVRINHGAGIMTNPSDILPGMKEGFAVRKGKGSFYGVYGTVSWQLSNAQRRFVLMWSAPYNFDYYSNWMGLGLTEPGITKVAPGMTWFNEMYYSNKFYEGNIHFERREFYYITDPVIYRDSNFEIVGAMTNVHNAEIRVIFRPIWNNTKDFAPAIAKLLENGLKLYY